MTRYLQRLQLLLILLGLMALVHVVNMVLGMALVNFGIVPRVLMSLPFIVTAPFIHGSDYHLLNNLVGLAVFGSLLLLHSKKFFIQACCFIVIVGGLFVWAFGRQTLHVGASGLVFGLWAVCVALAWVDRRPLNILVAVFVIVFYGGMIYGTLPTDPRVSFESHLFGAIAGLLFVLVERRHSLRGRS